MSVGMLVEELDKFLDIESGDMSEFQYEFLNGFLLKELCKVAFRIGETTDITQDILEGNI